MPDPRLYDFGYLKGKIGEGGGAAAAIAALYVPAPPWDDATGSRSLFGVDTPGIQSLPPGAT